MTRTIRYGLQILTFLLTPFNFYGQTNYLGFIDKYPIEFVIDSYSDGKVKALYAYLNYDEPIIINGELKQNRLTLYETDKRGKNRALLTFNNYNANNNILEGIWTDLDSNSHREFKITLTKTFDIAYGDSIEWVNREIIQPVSLKGKYFKLVISKFKGDFAAKVTGVKILEKGTDKLIQQIDLDCQLWGLANLSIGDYNFDGIVDFSVFEQSYAGPNTSSKYFLSNPKTGKFFDSGFVGSSLEFDPMAKRIYEHNQCCAGRSHMNAEYKVVNNKMVVVKMTCTEYDEETDDYKTVKCE